MLAMLACLMAPSSHGAETEAATNKALAQLSEAFYRQVYREASAGAQFKSGDIKALSSHINTLIKTGQGSLAAATLVNNLATALQHTDSRRSPFLMSVLLQYYLLDSAEQLADAVFNSGNTYASSRVHYRLALHYFEHDAIDQAIHHLTSIEAEGALTKKEQDYATVIFGISLQRVKKHREALKIYKKIEPESYYYSYAQLNSAVAFIRQGWWTDAQIAIERAIAADTPDELRDMNNRLLIVLAYSQLKNEFYRNARNTFRKVSLDSSYVHRALLGMGLSALSQKDYMGAVNAFARLKQMESHELTAMEAHLMVPYTYNQMGEIDQAAVNYAEAVAYFDNKKRYYDVQLLNLQRADNSETIDYWWDSVAASQKIAYRHIQGLSKTPISEKKIQNQLVQLSARIKSRVTQQVTAALQEKIAYIESYTSQSQFGLAKLYDNQ